VYRIVAEQDVGKEVIISSSILLRLVTTKPQVILVILSSTLVIPGVRAKLYTLRNKLKNLPWLSRKDTNVTPPYKQAGHGSCLPKSERLRHQVYFYKDFSRSDAVRWISHSFPAERPAGQHHFLSGVIGDEQMKVDVIIASIHTIMYCRSSYWQARSQSIHR
jgi:hypothetical protein